LDAAEFQPPFDKLSDLYLPAIFQQFFSFADIGLHGIIFVVVKSAVVERRGEFDLSRTLSLSK